MGNFDPLYASTTDNDTTTSTTPQNHITLSGLANDTEYIVFWGGEHDQDTGGTCSIEGYYNGSATNFITGIAPVSLYQAFSGIELITTGSPAGDLELRFSTSIITTTTAKLKNGRILAIPTTILTSKRHYIAAEPGASQVINSTSFLTISSIDFSSLVADNGDNWMSMFEVGVTVQGASTGNTEVIIRLARYDGSTIVETSPVHGMHATIASGQTTQEHQIVGHVFSMDDGDAVFLQASLVSGSSNNATVAVRGQCSFNLSEFEHGGFQNFSATATTQASDEVAGTVAYTINSGVSRDVIIFHTGGHEFNSGASAEPGFTLHDDEGLGTDLVERIHQGHSSSGTQTRACFQFAVKAFDDTGHAGNIVGHTLTFEQISSGNWPDRGPGTLAIFSSESQTVTLFSDFFGEVQREDYDDYRFPPLESSIAWYPENQYYAPVESSFALWPNFFYEDYDEVRFPPLESEIAFTAQNYYYSPPDSTFSLWPNFFYEDIYEEYRPQINYPLAIPVIDYTEDPYLAEQSSFTPGAITSGMFTPNAARSDSFIPGAATSGSYEPKATKSDIHP
jgi:hypothetical protein